jgi:hypothetical protein
MKPTKDNAIGTSFYGDYIHSTLKELREVMGEENKDYQSGDGKVQYQWILEMENDDIITIYDYKEYRSIDENEIISWHIGSHNKQSSMNARYEIEMLLYKHRSNNT